MRTNDGDADYPTILAAGPQPMMVTIQTDRGRCTVV